MKKIINKYFAIISLLSLFSACNEMELARLDAPNSVSWYSNADEVRYSLNALYSSSYFRTDNDFYTDDYHYRNNLDSYLSGTINSEWSGAKSIWTSCYQGISRVNTIIINIEEKGSFLTENQRNQYLGEAYVIKASIYGYLITHFGAVPYFDDFTGLDDAFNVPRTDVNTIKETVYQLFDSGAELLPTSYSGEQYITKGVAYAYKARIALWLGDYAEAAAAAKDCMDLEVYSLHPTYESLFHADTRVSPEIIFSFTRSAELGLYYGISGNKIADIRWFIPRNARGWGAYHPSWDLLASYTCKDGLPIDESPLFDPHNPFMDRDPRALATIIPFGKLTADDERTPDSGFDFYGYTFNPYPITYVVHSIEPGTEVINKDTKATQTWAPFNGLSINKGIDETWVDDRIADPNKIAMRYAEVLLTYAEAKIEMNQIDETVLDAINAVRSRAYADSDFDYPEVTTTNQSELRKILRMERRSEFALEGLRLMDILRWGIAEKTLVGNTYGLLNCNPVKIYETPNGDLIDKVVEPGHWFWGLTPEIDEDGIPDFSALLNADMCQVLFVKNWDSSKQMLFPIPEVEMRQNKGIGSNNPGY